MKQSMRAKRMARNHKRMAAQSKLSLVSLMDIFTILVFFLMLNASDVQVLQTHKSVTLPKSSSDTPAAENLLIMVNANDLLLQGQKLASVADVLAQSSDSIDVLANELTLQASLKRAGDSTVDEEFVGAVTIMGDQGLPYQLLKKIMQTCAEAGYTDISLAVEQDTSLQEGLQV